MNGFWIFAGVLLTTVSYVVHLNFFQLDIQKSDLRNETSTGYYDYRGVTHSHTSLSTGSGTPLEVIQAGQDSQLDFLILTDVNLPKQPRESEGYYGRMLVMVGGEYSYLDSRLMYYGGLAEAFPETRGQAQIFFADLLSQRERAPEAGWVALAHPLLSGYRWTGEYPEGLDGIEVINLKRVLDQAWRTSRLNAIWSLLIFPFNPQVALLFLFESPSEELALWDQLNHTRKTTGLVGTDATAKAIVFENSYLKFPSYETAFSVASNHVLLRSELTGNLGADRRKVLEALRFGHSYMAIDIIGDPKGFVFEALVEGRGHPMGSQVTLSKGLSLRVRLPAGIAVPFEAVIYKDGEVYLTSNSVDTELKGLTAGIYRVVVRVIPTFPFPFGRQWVPWIYSNPIYLR